MNKNDLNYWIDSLMLLGFLSVAVTGVVKFLAVQGVMLPVDFVLWSLVHEYSGLFLVVMVALHLILHFSWIIATTKRKLGRSRQPKERQPAENNPSE